MEQTKLQLDKPLLTHENHHVRFSLSQDVRMEGNAHALSITKKPNQTKTKNYLGGQTSLESNDPKHSAKLARQS